MTALKVVNVISDIINQVLMFMVGPKVFTMGQRDVTLWQKLFRNYLREHFI